MIAKFTDRAADQCPERLAIVCDERRFSYAQLHDRILRCVSLLRSYGVEFAGLTALDWLSRFRVKAIYFEICRPTGRPYPPKL